MPGEDQGFLMGCGPGVDQATTITAGSGPRRTMKVQPTARDKGLKLTLEVVAYDNGLVEIDTVPINDIVNDKDPSAHGWLGAAEVAVLTLGEFRRQAEQRRKERS